MKKYSFFAEQLFDKNPNFSQTILSILPVQYHVKIRLYRSAQFFDKNKKNFSQNAHFGSVGVSQICVLFINIRFKKLLDSDTCSQSFEKL
jgi:hypothetical protein